MATPSEKVFIDTNILVHAHLTLSPLFGTAVGKLRDLLAGGAELWISRQTLREYLSAMTKPGALTGSIPIQAIVADVRSFVAAFSIAEDYSAVTDNLLLLLGAVQVGRKQIHDANIVASMQAYGIPKLLTHNSADFARFASYITILPLVP
jgi:predicted nucleic acid-binding protein